MAKKYELTNLTNFDLKQIFECGQCFRARREKDLSYTVVIKNAVFHIAMSSKAKAEIQYESIGNSKIDFEEYFDLHRDYRDIQKRIAKNDCHMKEAIQYGSGIRILKQDPWEMLISFIISAANNIPRISKTVENLAREYGKKIVFQGKDYYLFPTPEELSKASLGDLRRLNLGFRDQYVYRSNRGNFNQKNKLRRVKDKKVFRC